MSAESQTCGQGLAASSALPARLADVTAAMAAVLTNHMGALDRADPTNQAELDAYRRLSDGYGRITADLRGAADLMAGSPELPMGRHDRAAMADDRAYAAFAELVRSKVDLERLLRDSVEGDREMLAQMRAATFG